MSFTLLVGALAVVVGAAGALAARSRRGPPSSPRLAGAAGARPEPGGGAPEADAALRRLPLRLGDVVSAEIERDGRARHEERWLRGGIVAREGGAVVGVLFAAPEGASTDGVVVFGEPRREIDWVSPVALELGREPPSTIEVGGRLYERRLRRPVELERVGVGAPDVPREALWIEYEGAGHEVALAISDGRGTWAYAGVRLDEGRYDRMGSGAEG